MYQKRLGIKMNLKESVNRELNHGITLINRFQIERKKDFGDMLETTDFDSLDLTYLPMGEHQDL